jgi:thiol-disulfide isomerase/thioredoxin
MKRKIIELVLLLAVCCAPFLAAQSRTVQSQDVHIYGTLVNFNLSGGFIDMDDVSQWSMFPNKQTKKLPVNQDGTFDYHFRLTEPSYFRIGRNQLYLSPSDNINMYVDYKDGRNATFEGRGNEANEYLRTTPFPKGGSYLSETPNFWKEGGTKPEVVVFQEVEQLANARKSQLQTLTHTSAAFINLEKARIKADVVNSILSFPVYKTILNRAKKMNRDSVQTALLTLLKPQLQQYAQGLNQVSYLNLPVMRDVLADVMRLSEPTKSYFRPQVFSQYMRDYFVAEGLASTIKYAERPLAKDSLNGVMRPLQTPVLKLQLKQLIDEYVPSRDGEPAQAFEATNEKGEAVRLEDYKGKVILLDLWATWCGPCLELMPAFEKLKEDYKDKNVIFISLSIDDDAVAWKQNMTARNATGLQWLIARPKLDYYQVVGVPRLIAIDKNFKIANYFAPEPHSAEIRRLLDKLLQ